MYNNSQKPSYRLECRNCPWKGMCFFDEMLPDQCPKCNRPAPKKYSLQTGAGYDHKTDYKRGEL